MQRDVWRRSLAHVALALKEPEDFAAAWQFQTESYRAPTWIALALTAMAGTVGYGMTIGMGQGVWSIISKAVLLTVAAGAAWAISLPALYVLNSLAGSRLDASTTLLAALVTTSWGGLALLASVPIGWFFTVAVPDLPMIGRSLAERIVLGVNLLVFAGVGVAMSDVFSRVMRRVQGRHTQPIWFLALVGAIGTQLFYLFGIFSR